MEEVGNIRYDLLPMLLQALDVLQLAGAMAKYAICRIPEHEKDTLRVGTCGCMYERAHMCMCISAYTCVRLSVHVRVSARAHARVCVTLWSANAAESGFGRMSAAV